VEAPKNPDETPNPSINKMEVEITGLED